MSDFGFDPTPIPGLTLVQRRPVEDARGMFTRVYCADEFGAAGLDRHIAQINHSYTRRRGAVRGLHFQHPPNAETKIVTCLSGAVFDVAVDLRAGSPSFLQWHAVILSAKRPHSIVIPQGCAHGFQTLTNNCEMLYLHSAPFHPESEAAINAVDPRLAIEWPLPIAEMSDRDLAHPFIDRHFSGMRL